MHFDTKHTVEEYLSALIPPNQAIVEIGVGFGNGIAAIRGGNKTSPVFGIDPYTTYKDPLGGSYGESTKTEMLARDLDFVYVPGTALEVIKHWRQPIGLLWLDLSMAYKDLMPIVEAWARYVVPGGYIGITGLCYPNQLGTKEVMIDLYSTGNYRPFLPEQDLVAVLRKHPDSMKRAAFWICDADNARYVFEAAKSAQSVKDNLGIDTVLFTNVLVDMKEFDVITPLPPRQYEHWYRNQVLFFNRAVDFLQDYDQLLYLDTDTYVCRPDMDVWRILDHYDMALGHAAGRGGTPTAVGCPSEFATLGVGVNFFRNTPKMRRFFDDWLRMFVSHYDVYQETDEAPIRDLLFLNNHGVSYFVLAPEEHCRFGFGVWLNGRVSILHGRVDTPLDEIAQEINRYSSMRLYRYNGKGQNGLFWYHKDPNEG